MIIHPQVEVPPTRIIRASYNSLKEWRADPKGYFTIKPFAKLIKVRFCNYEHKVLLVIEGRSAEEIYNTIIRENLVSRLDHAAYLGAELQKAEIALQNGLSYVQDDPLPI
ncbi:DUF4346 domain-containing protein [Candidatus Woesearchaeota archaeon]|nr:DUF4346 domain-containing protein [Candidatus Woesearchaeota archaeon]